MPSSRSTLPLELGTISKEMTRIVKFALFPTPDKPPYLTNPRPGGLDGALTELDYWIIVDRKPIGL